MSAVENDLMTKVLDHVSAWSPAQRITLARRILESLETGPVSEPLRARSLKDLVGMLKTDFTSPGDVECKNILEQELINKYGK